MLRISKELALPLDAVTEKLAFLGRTGGGKTYAAMKLCEQMLDSGAHVVALDPVGKWHGLRLAKDGKRAAYPIPVFGGLFGDLPLEPTAGALVADLIVDKKINAVVDVSQFILSEQTRFAFDFATRLYQRQKAAPAALHLFIEECQEFIPQNLSGTAREFEGKMLHAFERIWKLGRNAGIGGSLISQRPQEVNKKVLNMTECMFIFQMTGPQERKAVESWVGDKGLDQSVVDTLPYLKQGDCHVFSPVFLNVSKVIHIAEKVTFDASATPKVGARAIEHQPLSPIDVEEIKAAMTATIERQKENDPRELRRRVIELEREVKRLSEQQPAERVVEVPVLANGQMSAMMALFTDFRGLLARFDEQTGKVIDELARVGSQPARPQPVLSLKEALAFRETKPSRTAAKAARSTATVAPRGTFPLTGPEQRVLDAIAWFEALGITEPSKVAVGFIAGYRAGKKVGGTYGNVLGSLRTAGLVGYPAAGVVALTPEGRAVARDAGIEHTSDGLQEAVLARLDGPERRVLSNLINAYPNAMTKLELGELSGYSVADKVGGTFGNILGRLRTLGLINYPAHGWAKASPLLFLE